MSFIKNRLRRIEETVRGGPCPECDLSPDGTGYIVYDIVYEEGEQSQDPKSCQACGRPLELVIRVVYEGEGGAGYESV